MTDVRIDYIGTTFDGDIIFGSGIYLTDDGRGNYKYYLAVADKFVEVAEAHAARTVTEREVIPLCKF